jgi:hypothetical protein
MTSVTRRGFFGRLASVAVGAVAAMRAKPAPELLFPTGIKFHKDAFALLFNPPASLRNSFVRVNAADRTQLYNYMRSHEADMLRMAPKV